MSAQLTPKQTQRLDEISGSEAHFGEPWRGDTTDKSLVRRGLCRTYEVNGHPKIERLVAKANEVREIWEGLSVEGREWVLNPGPCRLHPFQELSSKLLVTMTKSTPPILNNLGRAVAEYGRSQS